MTSPKHATEYAMMFALKIRFRQTRSRYASGVTHREALKLTHPETNAPRFAESVGDIGRSPRLTNALLSCAAPRHTFSVRVGRHGTRRIQRQSQRTMRANTQATGGPRGELAKYRSQKTAAEHGATNGPTKSREITDSTGAVKACAAEKYWHAAQSCGSWHNLASAKDRVGEFDLR